MPFVDLNIVYQSNSGHWSASGQTDSSGSFILHSALAGASYTIDASIYDQIFNAGNNTISNLPAQATAASIHNLSKQNPITQCCRL